MSDTMTVPGGSPAPAPAPSADPAVPSPTPAAVSAMEPTPIGRGPLEDDTSAPFQPTFGEYIGSNAQVGWDTAKTFFTHPPELPDGVNPTDPTYARVSADDANAAAKAAGVTLDVPYTADTTQAGLNQVIADAQDRQKADQTTADYAPNILQKVANFGVSSLVSLADPRNLAAMAIPIPGSAWVGERVAAAAGEGMFGRLASGAATGAVQGAGQGIALLPAEYSQAQQDHQDFTVGTALHDVAMQTFLNAGLHAGGGIFGGATPTPDTLNAVARAATGQVLDSKPVDIGAIVDQDAAGRASVAAQNAREVARVQGLPMLRDAQAMRAEAAAIPNVVQSADSPETMLNPPQPDPITQARLDAAQEELTRPGAAPSAARQAELQAEIQSLTEGAAPGSDLEQARNESQRQGLLIAADRAEQNARDLMTKADQSAQGMASRALNPADPELARTQRVTQATMATAPKLEPSTEQADTEAMLSEVQERHAAAVQAGRTAELPADAPVDDPADQTLLKQHDARVAYAACMVGA